MATFSSLLDEALESWAGTREGIASEVENLPDDAMDFRPTPDVRTAGELVLHVVEVSLMMTGELTRADGDFQRQSYTDFIGEYAGKLPARASKADLLEILRTTHTEGDRRFRDAGELAMLQHIRRFDGVRGTRLAWLHHGVAHEEYHRGQLALYARHLGRVPALTQLIMGAGS